MSLEDPQTLTVGLDTVTLPRVSSGLDNGIFRSEDGANEIRVNHSYGKRVRSAVRLTHNLVDVDPLNPALNVPLSISVTLVVDAPKVGFAVASKRAVVEALLNLLSDNTFEVTTQVLGGQS